MIAQEAEKKWPSIFSTLRRDGERPILRGDSCIGLGYRHLSMNGRSVRVKYLLRHIRCANPCQTQP